MPANLKKSSLLASLILASLGAPALAAAPAGRYQVTSGTVLDEKTRLTWQRAASPTAMTWEEANAWCRGLALGGFAWRLPSRKELETLLDPRARAPAIDLSAFPETPATVFWSATPKAGDAASAWTIRFLDGVAGASALTATGFVRCVR